MTDLSRHLESVERKLKASDNGISPAFLASLTDLELAALQWSAVRYRTELEREIADERWAKAAGAEAAEETA